MSDWAQFWAVDLHVHTPGSSDAKDAAFGSADDIVSAAVAAGLDAIAITDHNTADWCEKVAQAAEGTALVVLPGLELSTTEGHLLAIWEEGTPVATLNDLLAQVGIGHAHRGKLEVSTKAGFADTAHLVVAAGGLAIPAHIDKPKGLLSMAVKANMKKIFLADDIAAVEIVKLETATDVDNQVSGKRTLACLRGSDTWDAATSAHALSGIGARRTWVKASRPDLVGIRHALADPDLRICLDAPPGPAYPRLERVQISGGFLDGQAVRLCPDLNCLLGGTGAGKSLVLEAVRYTLDQQLARDKFPKLWEEVQSRLGEALTETGVVTVDLVANGNRFRVERAYSKDGSASPVVKQLVQDDWLEVDLAPSALLTLAAFSQGEILEYSREPVGRMSLIDSGIDLSPLSAVIAEKTGALQANAQVLIAARKRVGALNERCATEATVQGQVDELSKLFSTEHVKQQAGWQTENSGLSNAQKAVLSLSSPTYSLPAFAANTLATNKDLFDAGAKVFEALSLALDAASKGIDDAVEVAKGETAKLQGAWSTRHDAFKAQLDAELAKVQEGATLVSLRARLADLQARMADIQTAKAELENVAQPALDDAAAKREQLIQELRDARHERRELRRARVDELNKKTAGFVKLDVPSNGDYSAFRAALEKLKVGSHVQGPVLEAIARTVHPLKFARALWNGNVTELVDATNGIDATSVARLLTNIADRGLDAELLATQVIDRPDTLTVRFRKPDDGSYTPIEQLAHGQRCTAILVILLADGEMPVLVDQPEDALHAPWIEDYLVDRLRSLRGTRQYLFATRSPGIVVSGDAEQIITMKATAGHGELEASGSLERHELNHLALHHLEGGPVAFDRRWRKLAVSTQHGP